MNDIDQLELAAEQPGFKYWASRDFLGQQTREAIAKAQIVLVPRENYGGQPHPVFPVGTTELFRSLRSKAPASIDVEIACEDVEYREVALHNELLRLGIILAKYAVVPVLVGLITDFLKTKLGRHFSRAEVEASLLIEGGPADHPQVVRLDYKGPASTFEKTVHADFLKLDAPQESAAKQIDNE